MCANYKRTKSYGQYLDAFSHTRIPLLSPPRHAAPNLEPQENVRPTDWAPIFRRPTETSAHIEMVMARWALVPSYWKGTYKEWTRKAATFNARVETAHKLPTFRRAFTTARCLIPADGWYEYTKLAVEPGEPERKGRLDKWLIQPYFDEPMMLGGLWSRFDDPEVGPTETFTMVMQDAPGDIRRYHDRAPIFLFQKDWDQWLSPAVQLYVSGPNGYPPTNRSFDVRKVS